MSNFPNDPKPGHVVKYVGIETSGGHHPHPQLEEFFNQRALVRSESEVTRDKLVQFVDPHTLSWEGVEKLISAQFLEVVGKAQMKKGDTDEDSDSSAAQNLRAWWLDTASEEIEPLLAKMVEYGGAGRANDLIHIGERLVAAGVPINKRFRHEDDIVPEGMLAELGVYFYIEGKMARWGAAIAEGRPVSDDTLLDIGIYVRMAQRIRAVGGWPV